MSKKAKFELPYPPSVNQWTRSVVGADRKVKVLKSKSFRDWMSKASLLIIQSKQPSFGKERVKLTVELYTTDNRRRDIDNCLKPILDVMTKAKVWEDDSQVDALEVLRYTDPKAGYASFVFITIETMAESFFLSDNSKPDTPKKQTRSKTRFKETSTEGNTNTLSKSKTPRRTKNSQQKRSISLETRTPIKSPSTYTDDKTLLNSLSFAQEEL